MPRRNGAAGDTNQINCWLLNMSFSGFLGSVGEVGKIDYIREVGLMDWLREVEMG